MSIRDVILRLRNEEVLTTFPNLYEAAAPGPEAGEVMKRWLVHHKAVRCTRSWPHVNARCVGVLGLPVRDEMDDRPIQREDQLGGSCVHHHPHAGDCSVLHTPGCHCIPEDQRDPDGQELADKVVMGSDPDAVNFVANVMGELDATRAEQQQEADAVAEPVPDGDDWAGELDVFQNLAERIRKFGQVDWGKPAATEMGGTFEVAGYEPRAVDGKTYLFERLIELGRVKARVSELAEENRKLRKRVKRLAKRLEPSGPDWYAESQNMKEQRDAARTQLEATVDAWKEKCAAAEHEATEAARERDGEHTARVSLANELAVLKRQWRDRGDRIIGLQADLKRAIAETQQWKAEAMCSRKDYAASEAGTAGDDSGSVRISGAGYPSDKAEDEG